MVYFKCHKLLYLFIIIINYIYKVTNILFYLCVSLGNQTKNGEMETEEEDEEEDLTYYYCRCRELVYAYYALNTAIYNHLSLKKNWWNISLAAWEIKDVVLKSKICINRDKDFEIGNLSLNSSSTKGKLISIFFAVVVVVVS